MVSLLRGCLLVMAMVVGLIGCSEPPRPSQVPKDFRPDLDGPVWLGGYKLRLPADTLVGGDLPIRAEFALQVLADGGDRPDVRFLSDAADPKQGWLIHAQIALYTDPLDLPPLFKAPGAGLIISPRLTPPHGAFIAEWIAPSTLHVRTEDVRLRYADEQPLLFNCYLPAEIYTQAQAQAGLDGQQLDGVQRTDHPAECSTTFMIRLGVRVLLRFPTRMVATGHAAVVDAIRLLDQSIENPKWSQYSNIPDSYDPLTDGPVWLGPYKVVLPQGTSIAGTTLDALRFGMMVVGDQVSFYTRIPGTDGPDADWLTRNTISYSILPGEAVAAGSTLAIKPRTEPWQLEWKLPSTIKITVPYITHWGGEPLVFDCGVPFEIFRAAYPTRDMSALRDAYPGTECMARLGIRPRLGLMFMFPISHINEAELPVLKAIQLIDQAIQEK